MKEKYKLNLAVGFAILLITIWLIVTKRLWDWTGQLFLIVAAVIIIRALLLREKKPARLLEFFVKSLIVSYMATCVIWLVLLGLTSPWFYAYLNLESLMNVLIFEVLPLSLLPVAISIMIYGIFKIRLKSWEFFLSSWYMSVFLVFTIYQIWWSLFVRPHLSEFYYSSIAGAIGFALGLVFLSFLIAGVFTFFYVLLKEPKSEPPP